MAVPYCIKCFQPLNGSDICPRCGGRNALYQPKINYLPVGTQLQGRYIVGKVLGEGGFGITYAGFDPQLRRRIAVKEYFPVGCVNRDINKSLRVTCSEMQDLRQIFDIGKQKALQEAQSLGQLDDIGDIVRVLDFFPENDTAYIIMEYVEGVTLREYVKSRGGVMQIGDAVELLMPIMLALRDIHARGFIHRDISPDNIMITAQRGNARLLDFGAVKSLMDTQGDYTQNVIIKRGYSPPELYSTEERIGPWSDVYSMCATLFFLVCGKKLQEPMGRLSHDTAPELLRQTVSPHYGAVLLKGLAVQAEQRYQNMDDLIRDLEAARAEKQNAAAYPESEPSITLQARPARSVDKADSDETMVAARQPAAYRMPPMGGGMPTGPAMAPDTPLDLPAKKKRKLPLILGACGVFMAVAAAVIIILISGRDTSDPSKHSTDEHTANPAAALPDAANDADAFCVMTHAEFETAELNETVCIETYVQAKQDWWDNTANVYAQSEDGAYYLYMMNCSEKDYALLTPGTKIRVTGIKSEWSGEIEIMDATFKVIEGSYIAEPIDVTDLLGTDELVKHQNELVSFKGATVVASQNAEENDVPIIYKGDSIGDDIYFKVSVNHQIYDFCIESYLTPDGSPAYEAAEKLKIGDVVDLEGFLYWYNGPNPHIVSISVVS